ncbi:hypothetical protein [Corynebacterium glyciniphilum]|uniref:hypothetical protein n=1 Tax=Corynebacterium glyciniphilum TaxID=1404244 RepID=UPI00264B7DC0|nr:hypothetical protein [Corynebacterium glyciniphilum]MDN6704569.1 hypothetical protein [Corynebacterium glyciniphilum]
MANPTDDRRRPNRTRRLDVRIGEAEKQRLKEFADERGVKVSALVLAAVLDVVEADRVPTSIAAAVDTDADASVAGAETRRSELAELTASVDAAGGPLNVIVHAAHSGETAVVPDPEGLMGVEDVLVEVRDALGQVREWVVAHEATAGGLRPLTTAVNRVVNNIGQLDHKVSAGEVDYLDGLDDAASVAAVLAEVQDVVEGVRARLGARVATPDGLKLQRVMAELNRVTAENKRLRKRLAGDRS